MDKKILILDGGMGRQLEQMGAPFRQPEWSALALMEAPEFVTKAHQQFVEAGAEILTTNSYALVPFHIGEEKFSSDGKKLIKLAAQLARNAADSAPHKVTVAGSLPPVFGSYRPDWFKADEAEAVYIPLISEQEDYVDVWIAETISSLIEAQTVMKCLEGSDKPVWMSFTITDRDGKDIPPQLRSGESVKEAATEAIRLGVSAILFNCSQPEEMGPALRIIQKMQLDIPYGVYANAFPPIKKDRNASGAVTKLRDDTTPERYLEIAQKWRDLGATIIGGCCGIGPEHIQALTKLND
jgi:homocysteine S-methyltransferase